MTNAVSMRWALMRQTSQESKGSSSTHFRPLKKNHKDSQAHYLEDDHKAIKYLWWHLVQNNCFRFKTSPGELPKSSSNFRYCSDIPSRIDGTLTALMQGADFISEGPTVSQTAHSAFKCKTSDLCWATQQKPFGFSMSSFSWQEKSFSLPFPFLFPCLLLCHSSGTWVSRRGSQQQNLGQTNSLQSDSWQEKEQHCQSKENILGWGKGGTGVTAQAGVELKPLLTFPCTEIALLTWLLNGILCH